MHDIGTMDDASYRKVTMRDIDRAEAATLAPLTGDEIRALREQAKMSQAVFAKYLNLTVGYVSQLERGAKHPSGPPSLCSMSSGAKVSKRSSKNRP